MGPVHEKREQKHRGKDGEGVALGVGTRECKAGEEEGGGRRWRREMMARQRGEKCCARVTCDTGRPQTAVRGSKRP